MRENVNEGRPFYAQLFHYAVHASTIVSKFESKAKFEAAERGKLHKDAAFAEMTWDLDQSIGEVLDEIENLGIADNTYIVFMSDNGGPSNPRFGPRNNAPLSKGKTTLYEGGIRVPFIISGPGIPANSHSAVSVTGCDLFPTFCEWAGVEINHSIDGSSLTALLSGKAKDLDRHVDSLLFHTPHYGRSQDAKPTTAIITGDLKLVKHWETNSYSLFDLSKDIGEKKNLASSQPEKLKKLIAVMDKRLLSVNAQLPTKNPDYDPNAPLPEPRGPRGRGQGRPGGPRGQGGGQDRPARGAD